MGLVGLDGARRQLLGPQCDHPHQGLRSPGRPAGSEGQTALRRPYPEPRLRRGGAAAPRGLVGLHAGRPPGLLRGKPALADRSLGPRPALVPGQPPAHAGHRRQGPEASDASAFRHRHHVLSGLAVLAVPADRRYRAGPADDLYPAGIFRPRLPPLSDLAAVRPRASPGAVRAHHGHPARAEGLRPPADAHPRRRSPRLRRCDPADRFIDDRNHPVRAPGADPDADPVGLGVPDPARTRHGLAAAAPRRRLDPLQGHRPPSPRAYGAWSARRHLRLHDRHVPVPVDVADDHRPAAGDPALLAQRAAGRRVWH